MQEKHYNILRNSAYGDLCGRATLKHSPIDFMVTEIPKYQPQGSGEHLWLWVKKTNANTDWVAGEIAKRTGLARRDVSYAGRKDRFAVTEQWFSLYDPKNIADPIDIAIEGVAIQKRIRHQQKLRTGQLRGNNFKISLRDVEGKKVDIDKRLEQIKKYGFPNYFGGQRFGHIGNNLIEAMEWCTNGGKKIRRNKQSIYLSCLRSFLFNAVLRERVKSSTWNRLIRGDLAQLAGSHSSFLVEDVEKEQIRCDAFDVHPTGPLPGKLKRNVMQQARDLEDKVLAEYGELIEFLATKMTADRRSLRVLPKQVQWRWQGTTLSIDFFLPAGSYATVLLEQIFELKQ